MRKIKTKIEMEKKEETNKKATGNMKWKSKEKEIKESKKHLQQTKKGFNIKKKGEEGRKLL